MSQILLAVLFFFCLLFSIFLTARLVVDIMSLAIDKIIKADDTTAFALITITLWTLFYYFSNQ